MILRIDHVAVWVRDLEAMRQFYVERLGGRSGPQYRNARTDFRSYFISFSEGARIELMSGPAVDQPAGASASTGYAHVALSVGTREGVDSLARALAASGVKVLGEPRTTGDGYYEAVVADPEGNRIEITA